MLSNDIPDYTIPSSEAFNILSHFIHLTGYIAAEDGGPFLHEDPEDLHVTVKRVDSNRRIFNDEFSWTSCGQRSISHL
jgi:hypothetical protein